MEFVYQDLSYKINGVLFEVYNELGPGLKENTYQRAIAVALSHTGLKFKEQVYFPLRFKNEVVGSLYFDFLIDEKIVLELKVGEYFSRRNIEQVHQYLLYSGLHLGLLANFTLHGVKIKRVVNLQNK